jgi:DNA-3-methyladenine glycosylase
VNTNAARDARRSSFGDPLPIAFYDRDPAVVSRELLGAVLSCETPEGIARGRIVETEAYLGPHDPACHAAAGLTARTRHLHGPPGHAYVYFIYGVHWCFNAVTMPEGVGSAVLVRALEPIDGIDLMRMRRPRARRDVDLTNGPGKLCAALGIDGTMDGLPLQRPPLTINEAPQLPDDRVLVSARIGITKAADWPLRFFERDNPYVSKTPAKFEVKELSALSHP